MMFIGEFSFKANVSGQPDILRDGRPYLKPVFVHADILIHGEWVWDIEGLRPVEVHGFLYNEDGSLGTRDGLCLYSLPWSDEKDIPVWLPGVVRTGMRDHLDKVDTMLGNGEI